MKVWSKMENPLYLYEGNWPRVAGKSAKYAVRIADGNWLVSIYLNLNDEEKFLDIAGQDFGVVEKVNSVKQLLGGIGGGVFYINEFRHLIVPNVVNGNAIFYYGGRVDENLEFEFEYESTKFTSMPKLRNGTPIGMGDEWNGPRPGIPYILAPGGRDIYYERPKFDQTKSQDILDDDIVRVKLSTVIESETRLKKISDKILKVKGYQGGRFYVNEHRAIFVPVLGENETELNYIYCGQLDLENWFSEPLIPEGWEN